MWDIIDEYRKLTGRLRVCYAGSMRIPQFYVINRKYARQNIAIRNGSKENTNCTDFTCIPISQDFFGCFRNAIKRRLKSTYVCWCLVVSVPFRRFCIHMCISTHSGILIVVNWLGCCLQIGTFIQFRIGNLFRIYLSLLRFINGHLLSDTITVRAEHWTIK